MVFQDDAPRPVSDERALHADLSDWSIEALSERVNLLEAEIERTKAMILEKQAGQAAAEAVFKKA